MKEKKRGLRSVRTLTTAAMLTALSIIIGSFSERFLDFGVVRLTFENFPIILSGILYGPIVGGLVGLTSDLVSSWFAGNNADIIIAVGAALMGVVPGIISHYVMKKEGILRIVVSAGAAHAVGSMIVKSIGLHFLTNNEKTLIAIILGRIPVYLAIAAVEIFLLCFLFKKTSYRKLFYGKGELK